MFFKKKCPSCGARAPRERLTCAECGAALDSRQTETPVTGLPLETIDDIESTTLCKTCQVEQSCVRRGIFGRQICMQYEPLPTVEIREDNELMEAVMAKACPECGSENYRDSEDNPLLEDDTIGHCLDCGIYWCLDCGYVFESVEEGMKCPHWEICADCSDEYGYLDQVEFVETICSTCEHYDNGCQMADPSKCDDRWQLLCPYQDDVSGCAKVGVISEIADSREPEVEYVRYIPGKCAYCGSSNVDEKLKSKIQGTVVSGYWWDIDCADCGSKWVALEKPDFQ